MQINRAHMCLYQNMRVVYVTWILCKIYIESNDAHINYVYNYIYIYMHMYIYISTYICVCAHI